MGRKNYISVILPLKLEWEPCYSVPDGTDAVEGDRVRVSFSGKEYIGVVGRTGVEPETSPSKIKDIISVEHGLGRISPEETGFWKALADYYLCTAGEVYKAAYPAGKITHEETRARALLKASEREAALREKAEKKREVLEKRLEMRCGALARAKKESVKVRLADEINRIEQELLKISVSCQEQESIDDRDTSWCSGMTEMPVCLSVAQEKACDSIKDGFAAGKVVLLDGVTGSGKTEVYLKFASDAIADGRNVLYMVPEIAVSRQLEDRLRVVFGDRLLTFHSGESPAHRRKVAEMVRDKGKSGYVVLGTRSSVFLPHNNLGLIIVDEEHDGSYKQESPSPRYNGRDAAIMLANVHDSSASLQGLGLKGKCNVLLGSATPSLESLYNCDTGKFVKVDLKKKYYGSDNAEVEIIDTGAERRKRGMTGTFSKKLIAHIDRTLKSGGQAIVLRARRSYSPVMQCSGCGFIPKCPYCNVSLSYHKMKGRLVCHYCGHGMPYMQICPKCGAPMTGMGAGTQKVEEELTSLFPDAKVARLDSDSAQNKSYEERVIKDFAKKEIDILVGTQIVTKGFDFPHLALVAVLQADTLVGMQDFRADEKAMQVLEQFRGRCGRRGSKGLFVIQTAQPEHPVYQGMKSGKETEFSGNLLLERRTFGYPPFSRLVNVTVRNHIEERAAKIADDLAALLKDKSMDVAGPFVPGSGMAEGNHLRMLRVCFRRDKNLKANKFLLKRSVSDFEVKHRCQGHIIIDVDPS